MGHDESSVEKAPWYELSLRIQVGITFLAIVAWCPLQIPDVLRKRPGTTGLFWALLLTVGALMFLWIAYRSFHSAYTRWQGVPLTSPQTKLTIDPRHPNIFILALAGAGFTAWGISEAKPAIIAVGAYLLWFGLCGCLWALHLSRNGVERLTRSRK